LKKYIPKHFKRSVRRILKSIWESTVYRLTKIRPAVSSPHHIVFVCKGNICRSIFAEKYLKGLNSNEAIKIESCGIDVNQGVHSPAEVKLVGLEYGLEFSSHISKGLIDCDLNAADLIVAMEYLHYARLVAMFPAFKYKIRLLRDFSPWPTRLICNIYDPFGLPENEFRLCFQQIKVALDGLNKCLLR